MIKKFDCDTVLDAPFVSVAVAVAVDLISLPATQHDRNLFVELSSQLKEQRRVSRLASYKYMALGQEFHRTLLIGTRKGKVWKMLDDIKSRMDRVRYLNSGISPIENPIKQRESIINDIEITHVKKTNTKIGNHLRECLANLSRVQQLYLDNI